jgi:hypothetical protein
VGGQECRHNRDSTTKPQDEDFMVVTASRFSGWRDESANYTALHWIPGH